MIIPILKWYIIGVLVSTLTAFASEHFYLCSGKSQALSWENCKDNFVLTALSWIGVALALLYYVIELATGFLLTVKTFSCMTMSKNSRKNKIPTV